MSLSNGKASMEKTDESRALGSREIRERNRIQQRGFERPQPAHRSRTSSVTFVEIREISSERKEHSPGSEVVFAHSGFATPLQGDRVARVSVHHPEAPFFFLLKTGPLNVVMHECGVSL